MKKNKGPKRHRILNKHTIIGFILIFIWAECLREIVGGVDTYIAKEVPGWIPGIVTSLFSLFLLWRFKRWYRAEFKGCLKVKKDAFVMGMKMLWPVWVVTVLSAILTVPRCGLEGLTAYNIGLALIAGVGEECVFRGILSSYLMRNWGTQNKLMAAAIVPSVVFGLYHLVNLMAGANLEMTVLQVVYAACFGLFAAAVLFRTGSIVPMIIAHTLNDIVSFMDTSATQGGVIIQDGISAGDIPSMISLTVFALMGFYLLRSQKREEIVRLWDEKWSRNDTVISQ